MRPVLRISRFALPACTAALAACGGRPAIPAPAPSPQVAAAAVVAGDSAGLVLTGTPVQGVAVVAGTGEVMRAKAGAPRRSDRQSLTRDEILSTEYTNIYDVVLALRGNWLRTRTAESIQGKSSRLQVYLDTQRLPGVDDLRVITPRIIESVRFLDPIQASARWGMDHGAGAILVTTAKR